MVLLIVYNQESIKVKIGAILLLLHKIIITKMDSFIKLKLEKWVPPQDYNA